MSVLNRQQRAVVSADTHIDPLIIDRVCDAFDALIQRGDVEAYKRFMMTAMAQQGLPIPTPPEERPTAVDKVKTICIRAYSDTEHISFKRAVARLREMQQG